MSRTAVLLDQIDSLGCASITITGPLQGHRENLYVIAIIFADLETSN